MTLQCDDVFGRPRQGGEDKNDAGIELAGVPLDPTAEIVFRCGSIANHDKFDLVVGLVSRMIQPHPGQNQPVSASRTLQRSACRVASSQNEERA